MIRTEVLVEAQDVILVVEGVVEGVVVLETTLLPSISL